MLFWHAFVLGLSSARIIDNNTMLRLVALLPEHDWSAVKEAMLKGDPTWQPLDRRSFCRRPLPGHRDAARRRRHRGEASHLDCESDSSWDAIPHPAARP